ncbi:hypothetical protein DYBT9275_04655 [Dyadobacter sp. CECT 9275]|uniref:DinB-like domain-containing protein n=1 Tax=Dyadobacter helix TaxID=2822344 RepID=A0A916JFU3_9BACT|nr:DinB family protein [Dyadobacter sp. CECT 9275]CAG5010154.1 hypothetical protein DYBT9275_04655 [Dyadobacter sp. CECT 9275]
MTETEIYIRQTSDAYEWVNKLVGTTPVEKWKIIPDIIETSIDWQVGHLIISHYFHSIMVIRGHQMDILKQLPIKEYSTWFTETFPSYSEGKTDSLQLWDDLKFMQRRSLEILAALSPTELDNPLEPTPTPHPIALTKREAIEWNIKHTMYHCGQIGILKRVVDQRYDFGLRLAK